MPVLDVQKLLTPISPDQPCGDDLSYDKEYLALELAAKGKEATQVGDSVIAAEEPNWRQIRESGVEVFSRSKDLQVAIHLVNAATELGGYPGLLDGLALIRGLLDQFWEPMYPRLDPDDANDPTQRMNTLKNITESPAFKQRLLMAPLCEAKQVGRYCLRDVLVATGDLPAPSRDDGKPAPPEMSIIHAACKEMELKDLEERSAAIAQCSEHVAWIDQKLMELVGSNFALDMSMLKSLLDKASRFLLEQLAERGVGVAPEPESSGGGASGGSGGGGPSISGDVRSSQDVIRTLQKIISYYDRNEPSSPVPMLLERAIRLVSKDFWEILEDLGGQDVATNVRIIRGVDNPPPAE